MKRILFFSAVAAIAFSSCSKSEVYENDSELNAISLSSYSAKSTKSAGLIEANAFKPGDIFDVYAYSSDAQGFANEVSSTPDFMKDLDVNVGGTSSALTYTYSPVRYWPTDEVNNLLTFFATYPANNNNLKPDFSANKLGSYTYTVSTDAAKQYDFMLADPAIDQTFNKTNSNVKGLVKLNFHHMLSQINFSVKLADDLDAATTVTLKSITLNNISAKGVVAIENTDVVSNNWTVEGSTAYPVAKLANTELSTTAVATSGETSLILLPQALAAGEKTFTVVYELQTVVGDDTYTITNTHTFDLKKGDIESWANNGKYTYTITIGLNVIKFTASVADWEENKEATIEY